MIDTNRLTSFAGVIDHAIRKGEGRLPVTRYDSYLIREAANEIEALQEELIAALTDIVHNENKYGIGDTEEDEARIEELQAAIKEQES